MCIRDSNNNNNGDDAGLLDFLTDTLGQIFGGGR